MRLISRQTDNKIAKFLNSFDILKNDILAELKANGFQAGGYAMYYGDRVLITKILISYDCEITFIYKKKGSDNEYEGSGECFLPII